MHLRRSEAAQASEVERGHPPVGGVLEQVLPQLARWRLLAVRCKAPSLGLALQKQGVSKLRRCVRDC